MSLHNGIASARRDDVDTARVSFDPLDADVQTANVGQRKPAKDTSAAVARGCQMVLLIRRECVKGQYNSCMSTRKRYRKRQEQFVTAVRLDLELQAFDYRKWGGEQHGKQGDWLVDNNGDVYTVDGQVFPSTYRQLSPGVYVKTTPIYAVKATADGRVQTKEGMSEYRAGDYIVSNDAEGTDAYCISAEKFEAMYEPDE